MFTDFIKQILGAERRTTTPNRLENNAAPSVTARKDSTEKYQEDIAALGREVRQFLFTNRTLYQPYSATPLNNTLFISYRNQTFQLDSYGLLIFSKNRDSSPKNTVWNSEDPSQSEEF